MQLSRYTKVLINSACIQEILLTALIPATALPHSELIRCFLLLLSSLAIGIWYFEVLLLVRVAYLFFSCCYDSIVIMHILFTLLSLYLCYIIHKLYLILKKI